MRTTLIGVRDGSSGENFADDAATFDAGGARDAAAVGELEIVVVQTQLVKDGRVEVEEMDFAIDGLRAVSSVRT